ncbi:MAG: cytochrome c3 family protein [Eggerthella lenta]
MTAQREYNPHSNYHEELACGTCHKSHTASVMQCAQCHSDADVPAGWVVR